MNKNIDIEKRFLLQIFNCTQEQLTKIVSLIRTFEKDNKIDLVKDLCRQVSQRNNEFSLLYGKNYFSWLVNLIVGEYISHYFEKKGISPNSDFYELFSDILLDIPDYSQLELEAPLEVEKFLLEFGITPKEWKTFRMKLDNLIKN